MRNKKILLQILAFTLTLIFSFTSPVYAGEVYTASTTGYYSHPVTGEIEDAGNNPGIGQGMVDNVVNGFSLIEKDDDGRLYATVRYSLRDNIENVRVWVQNRGDANFTQVKVEETKHEGGKGDFRFEIPSTDCVIRSSFFVGPMGRDVIFFIDFASLEEGNTDFKVFVNTDEEVKKVETEDSSEEKESSPADAILSKYKKEDKEKEDKERNEEKIREETSKKEPVKKLEKKTKQIKTPEKTSKKEDKINQTDLGYEHGLLTKRDFPDNKDEREIKEVTEWGGITRILFKMIIIVLSVMIALFFMSAVLIVGLYRYKKNKNIEIEKLLEEKND